MNKTPCLSLEFPAPQPSMISPEFRIYPKPLGLSFETLQIWPLYIFITYPKLPRKKCFFSDCLPPHFITSLDCPPPSSSHPEPRIFFGYGTRHSLILPNAAFTSNLSLQRSLILFRDMCSTYLSTIPCKYSLPSYPVFKIHIS